MTSRDAPCSLNDKRRMPRPVVIRGQLLIAGLLHFLFKLLFWFGLIFIGKLFASILSVLVMYFVWEDIGN